jgi:hypothetical protein
LCGSEELNLWATASTHAVEVSICSTVFTSPAQAAFSIFALVALPALEFQLVHAL